MNNIELQSKQKHVELYLELCVAVKDLQTEFRNAEELSEKLRAKLSPVSDLFPLVRRSGKVVRELSIAVIAKADNLWDSINDSIISAAKMTDDEYNTLKDLDPQLAKDLKSIPGGMLEAIQGFKNEVINQAVKDFNVNGLLTVEQSIKFAELGKAIVLDFIPRFSTLNKVFDIITDIDIEKDVTDSVTEATRQRLVIKILTIASFEVGIAMRLAETSTTMLKAVYSKVEDVISNSAI